MVTPPPLPGVLAEIAAVAGEAAALKVAMAKGGTRAYFPSRPAAGHWLVEAVGIDAAAAICAHLVSDRGGLEIPVPLGPTGTRARTWRAIRQAIDAGATAAEAARIAGVDERTVRRHRNGHTGACRDSDQPELF